MASRERQAIDQGWYYVVHDSPASAAGERILEARDGTLLTRRAHGYRGRVVVRGAPGEPVAAWLARARAQAGREEPVCGDGSPYEPRPGGLQPARRVLAFESLMATDMPHNDKEISQGVLHMLAPLAGRHVDVRLARVKMPIIGDHRPPRGLEHLTSEDLAGVELVLLSLLEGYWHGAVRLIEHLRSLGCRAHIAVGGVMPTLAPEHVAAHLPGASFVCRGAGEVFVPALVDLVGGTDVDTPFTNAQIAALLDLRGLIAIDRAGHTLVASDPGVTLEVPDLDRVSLDLSHVQPHHIEGGIEITTSRGCVHRCTFCSIIGRERYQARSAGSVFDLLDGYQARYTELFGDQVPPNAYRVHIADDDFACDTERALAFFAHLRATPFRLSSVQVSVADLCERENGVLQPRVDPRWVEALDPRCFADHGRPIPRSERIEDQRERGWSAYLQIGVETFSERELVRLGKGYRVAHIRAVVEALAPQDVHLDAYFIQSNTDTTAADLVDSVSELCRLKIRFPLHLHLRFPVVPHLVSYFPTATYRRKVRQGRFDSVAVIETLRVPGHPELDYPLVDHDLPDDPWVARAVGHGFLTDARRYTASLDALRALWVDAPEPLRRRLDDLPRRLAFEALEDLRRSQQGRPVPGWSTAPDSAEVLRSAEAILGPRDAWLRAFKRWTESTAPRLVVIPTWQCELRCTYCYIPKQDGRVMTEATMRRSIELLLSSSRESVLLQFFGGEALIEWATVRDAIAWATEQAAAAGRHIGFVLSTNGWSLDDTKLAWLSAYDVKLELSLDGDPDTQNRFRHSRNRDEDSYQTGIPTRADAILASGLAYDVIMVVHPLNADRLFENFFHIVGLGFRRVQINVGLGMRWRAAQHTTFVEQLHAVGLELLERWRAGENDLVFVNAEDRPMPMRLNGEVTVDWDGTVYGGNNFLHETEHKHRFVLGHLDDASNFDRYWLDGPENDELLAYSYPPEITRNNLAVGKTLRDFCAWLRREAPADAPMKHRDG